MARKVVAVRLRPEEVELLRRLSEEKGVTQSAIITLALQAYAAQEAKKK